MENKQIDIQKITHLLQALRDSCLQGEDGSWDCSTDEGKEGFQVMAVDCEVIAEELGITLTPYEPDDSDNEDE
jgi:hypothetical protein